MAKAKATDTAGCGPVNEAAARHLAAFIERIERLGEEIASLKDELREVYAEAKGCGFDPGGIRKVVALRAKDPDKLKEAEAIEQVYIEALGALVGSPLGEWARGHMKDMGQGRVKAAVTSSGIVVEQFARALDALTDAETAAAE